MSKIGRASAMSLLSLATTFASVPTVQAAEYIITSPSCGPYHLALCKDPAERARQEQRRGELDAEKAAQARAAEAARLKREVEIKDMMKRMNLSPQQEADARRLYEMRQAAEAAKPKLPGTLAKPAPVPTPDAKDTCPVRKPYEEVLTASSGARLPTREAAMAAVMQSGGVYDVQCSGNDFGWQCNGQRKTGRTLYACTGSAAQ